MSPAELFPWELHVVQDSGPGCVPGAHFVEVWIKGHFPRRSFMNPQNDPIVLTVFCEPGETPEEAIEKAWEEEMDPGNPYPLPPLQRSALQFAFEEMS